MPALLNLQASGLKSQDINIAISVCTVFTNTLNTFSDEVRKHYTKLKVRDSVNKETHVWGVKSKFPVSDRSWHTLPPVLRACTQMCRVHGSQHGMRWGEGGFQCSKGSGPLLPKVKCMALQEAPDTSNSLSCLLTFFFQTSPSRYVEEKNHIT